MNDTVITFTGDHGGTYYVPSDQAQYINTENLTNTGSEPIHLYAEYNDRNDAHIVLYFGSKPIWVDGEDEEIIETVEDVSLNGYGNMLHEWPVVSAAFVLIVAFCCLMTLLIKK